MKRIRVLLVDDQALFREGLLVLLGVRPHLEVVGEAGDGETAVQLAEQLRPDVVLMDLRMPGMGGAEATARIRAQLPDVRVVALTTFEDDETVFAALRAGAVGYVLKDAGSAQLVHAIELAASGASFLEPKVATRVVAELARRMETTPAVSAVPSAVLSEREREVLRLLARGEKNKDIGAALFIAEGTVKNHVTNIFAKLGVEDWMAAALRGRALGIV